MFALPVISCRIYAEPTRAAAEIFFCSIEMCSIEVTIVEGRWGCWPSNTLCFLLLCLALQTCNENCVIG